MKTGEIQSLLADSPELESALAAIRAVDREQEAWTFDDIPVDSGAFGELVSEGVVESVGDEYRMVDPEAVDRALDSEFDADSDTDASAGFKLSLPAIDRVAAGLLAGILLLTVAIRASTYAAVFRDRVVYSGNDPYFYVYLIESGLRNGWGFTDLPGSQATEEPLTTVQLLYSAELAGGLGSHRPILAWLPVILAVATVFILYLFTYEVSEDRRIALASAFVLAILPVNVLRSALGFVDHDPFDLFWLTVTPLGLVRTLTIDTIGVNRETMTAIALLGVGVAGSVLAWWAAALLLVPIAIAITFGGALAVRDERSFYQPGLTTAAGVGLGAGIVLFAHVRWGWHDRLIVGIPLALTVGIVGVVAATALWHHLPIPAWMFPITGILGAGVAAAAVSLLSPEEWAQISERLSGLIAGRGIAEVQSLFNATTMGWLFLFGLVLFVILPSMMWGIARIYRGDRRWLVAGSYAWFILFLAAVQSRYAGNFSPFAALFGGVALVYLIERVDAGRPAVPFGGEERPLSIPDRGVAFRMIGVVILVCGLSIVLAPIAANNAAIPEEQYETAVFIDHHAAENGYEYPDSYVFSPWSWNRMYNYHVSGESRRDNYAQSHYRDFTVYEDPNEAYQRIEGGRADGAYLVTEPFPGDVDVPATAMQSRLHNRLGSRGEGVAGLGHYRAWYVSDSGDYKVFRVVPGATVEGQANGTSVRLSTDVKIEGGSFTYERDATVADGTFTVRVPYPGTYELKGASTDSVTVNESTVTDGATVQVEVAAG